MIDALRCTRTQSLSRPWLSFAPPGAYTPPFLKQVLRQQLNVNGSDREMNPANTQELKTTRRATGNSITTQTFHKITTRGLMCDFHQVLQYIGKFRKEGHQVVCKKSKKHSFIRKAEHYNKEIS